MKTNTAKKMRNKLVNRIKEIAPIGTILALREEPDTKVDDRIAAHDLFSLFTANIIKKKVTFTR